MTGFVHTLVDAARNATPGLLFGPLLLVPFFIAEQVWPVERRPGWRDYGLNILISASSVYLALPAGMAAGICSIHLRGLLPWEALAFSFDSIAAVPLAGPALEVLALVFVPLLLHDAWFYWAHRIEHRVPVLWEFHKLHHSDELLNASTFGRDHFLQAVWIGFFPAFSLGLIFDLTVLQTGKAAMYSSLFLVLQSMLYHSALRLRLPWLDCVLVTPQVHRIHHSRDPHHYNCNYADVFPFFDILFGTWRRPGPQEFPSTGLGHGDSAPRSLWQAQVGPIVAAARILRGN